MHGTPATCSIKHTHTHTVLLFLCWGSGGFRAVLQLVSWCGFFRWVSGWVSERVSGWVSEWVGELTKRLACTQIITAHHLLPLSHLFTQQLDLAEVFLYDHTHTYNSLYIGLSVRNCFPMICCSEKRNIVVRQQCVGQCLELNMQSFIITSKCVAPKSLYNWSQFVDFICKTPVKPRHDRKSCFSKTQGYIDIKPVNYLWGL